MKKSLLLAAAGLAAVALLPNAAIPGSGGVANAADFVSKLDTKGRTVSFGHTPGATVEVRIANFTPKTVKANACGLARAQVGAYPDTYVWSATTYLLLDNMQDTTPLPVAAVPTCTGATPSAAVPATFKTATGEVWKSGLTPAATYYTSDGSTQPFIAIKAKADACGIAKHSIAAKLSKVGAPMNWDGTIAFGPMPLIESPDYYTGTGALTADVIDDNTTTDEIPICSKAKLYVKATN
jgi:hypothetical protein